MSAPLRTRAALITLQPVRRAASAQKAGPSSPWSWSIVSSTASAVCASSSSVGFTNTPATSTRRLTAAAISAAAAGSHRRGEAGQKIRPIAHAPSLTARSASISVVMPQNLTLVDTRLIVGLSGQLQAGRLDICGSHQSLSDERRARLRASQLLQLVAPAEPGLGDDHGPGRNARKQFEGPRRVHLERGQITVVDPDDRRAGVQRDLELAFVVHLDERAHAE